MPNVRPLKTKGCHVSNGERLKKELETYDKRRPELIGDSEGKFVLIHGEDVVGTWDTYEDALKAGYQQFGLAPFLVKQISGVEAVQFLTRDVPLCR